MCDPRVVLRVLSLLGLCFVVLIGGVSPAFADKEGAFVRDDLASQMAHLDLASLPDRGEAKTSAYIRYWVEARGAASDALTVDTLPIDSPGWRTLKAPYLNAGFRTEIYWLALPLQNSSKRPVSFILDVGYGLLDSLELTLVHEETGAQQRFTAGDKRPYTERSVDYPNFAFPLQLEPQATYQVYLRVDTTSSMQVPVNLWDPVQFAEVRYKEALFFGVLIGMILIMAVYNLFLFVALRDLSYLYFSFCLTGYVLVEMVLSSTAFAYLWPESVIWNDNALVVSSNLALAGLAMFAIQFLNMRAAAPRGWRLLMIQCAFCVVLALLAFTLPYQRMIMLTAVNVVAVPMTGYIIGIILWKRGFIAARYFSIAFTCFVGSSTIFVLSKFGILPRNFFTEYSIHVGAVSVVALLSFALADRVNREKVEKESAQQSAIENLEKYRLLYENSLEGMFRIDEKGRVLAVNPAFAKTMGVNSEEELLAQVSSLDGLVPADSQAKATIRKELETQGHLFGYEVQCRRLDGSEFWAALFARVLRHPATREFFVEGSLVDITEKKMNEEQLHFLARHDPLTRLLNRTEMERRLKRAIAQAHEGKARHVFLFLDLDQFKVVNDTCGHRAGDELLRQLAHLFQRHLRSRDALARLGGDEFAILFEHCRVDNAVEIAEALRQEVTEYRFCWNEKVFRVGASIGIVAITPESKSMDEVLSQADIACYAAKDAGRNQVVVHTEAREDLSKRQSDMELVVILREAIRDNRLCLHFQRIFPCGESRDGGERLEVLVRLSHEGGIMMPGSFLPVAERYNLIVELDCWVVEHCLAWLEANPERTLQMAQININLSGQTISNADAMGRLLKLLDRNSGVADKVCFEITEHAAITNMTETSHFVRTLRSRGIRFSLDDFGSGFSSYSHLKHLPVTSLKIDGSFVRDINTDPFDLAMVKSITDIAHTMGLAVVAEFVENQAILDTLNQLGIDFVQGYHLHQPEPLV